MHCERKYFESVIYRSRRHHKPSSICYTVQNTGCSIFDHLVIFKRFMCMIIELSTSWVNLIVNYIIIAFYNKDFIRLNVHNFVTHFIL